MRGKLCIQRCKAQTPKIGKHSITFLGSLSKEVGLRTNGFGQTGLPCPTLQRRGMQNFQLRQGWCGLVTGDCVSQKAWEGLFSAAWQLARGQSDKKEETDFLVFLHADSCLLCAAQQLLTVNCVAPLAFLKYTASGFSPAGFPCLPASFLSHLGSSEVCTMG